MSEQLWCYELLMEEFGPVPLSEVRQMVDDGMLSESDRVRIATSSDWMTVAELPAFVAAMTDTHSAHVGNEQDTDDRHGDLDIDSFSFESNSPAGDDELPGDLDIDSFNLHGDSDSPQPVVTNPHKPPEPEEDDDEDDWEPTFFVQSLGQEWGPLTQEELVEMACAGSLSRGDEIREGTEGRWIAVETIPGVGEEILRQHELITSSATADAKPVKKAKKKATGTKAKRKSKSGPGRKKKRKKKAKDDELLKEIFAEVFTDDGKVREERLATATPATVSHTTDPGDGTAVPETETPATAGAMSGVPGAVPGMNASAIPPMPTAPAMASAPPAFAKPKAPPRRAKKSSGGGGGGFVMPEPKVLGMIGGGVLLVLIVVGGYMGVLPGFGTDPETLFKEFATGYQAALGGTDEEWKQFRLDYAGSAREVAIRLAPQVSSDPQAKRFQAAATHIIKILSKPKTDAESHKELYAEFNKTLAGG